MLINLTDYFKTPDKKDELLIRYEAESLDVEGRKFPVDPGEGLRMTVTNIGNGQVRLAAAGVIKITMPCDRCLSDVKVPIDIDFDYTVIEPDGFNEIDDEQSIFMDGYDLDCELILHNELIMGLPMKVLCKDDCKGLCPVCGRNRNEGECGCDTFVPDPRMAAIQDIFNANK